MTVRLATTSSTLSTEQVLTDVAFILSLTICRALELIWTEICAGCRLTLDLPGFISVSLRTGQIIYAAVCIQCRSLVHLETIQGVVYKITDVALSWSAYCADFVVNLVSIQTENIQNLVSCMELQFIQCRKSGCDIHFMHCTACTPTIINLNTWFGSEKCEGPLPTYHPSYGKPVSSNILQHNMLVKSE